MDQVLKDAYKAHGDAMAENLRARMELWQYMDKDPEYLHPA